MAIQELIDRCKRNDSEAWAVLWQLVEGAAAHPLRRILQAWNMDPSLADDVLQELYRYLQADDIRRLRAFRGSSEPELKAFLRMVIRRFAAKLLRKWQHKKRREAQALRHLAAAEGAGPTEQQIEVALQDLESAMSDRDLRRLRIVSNRLPFPGFELGETLAPQPHSLRTIRHWRKELYRKYSDHIV